MSRKNLFISALVIAVIMVIFILILAAGARNRQEIPSNGTGETEAALPVEVEMVRIIPFRQDIASIGNILAARTVIIYPRVTGTLEKLYVEEGQFIREGELVASIESERRRLAVEQVENQIKSHYHELRNMENDLERFKNLYHEGAVSEKQFRDIETLYNATLHRIKGMESQLESAKKAFQDTTIYSPMTGIVSRKMIDEGELVTESTMSKTSPIVEIMDLETVRIILPVGAEDIGLVKTGQKALIRAGSPSEKVFHGTVDKIATLVNPGTRTTDVEIAVANPGYFLKPGMFTNVTLETGTQRLLAVTLDAVLRIPGSGNYSCFRLKEDNTVERVYIEIGDLQDGFAEVRAGLNEGDYVAVTSQGVLETGRRVVPEYPEGGEK